MLYRYSVSERAEAYALDDAGDLDFESQNSPLLSLVRELGFIYILIMEKINVLLHARVARARNALRFSSLKAII